MAGADFLAALVANCFLGALPPVDLRAVCFVRAIFLFFLSEKLRLIMMWVRASLYALEWRRISELDDDWFALF